MTKEISVTGDDNLPTGDPYLDQALREAAEDEHVFGTSRTAASIMKRATELFDVEYGVAKEGVKPQFIYRRAVEEIANQLVADRLKELGHAPPVEPVDEAQIIADAEKRLKEQGWLRKVDVETEIDQRAKAKISENAIQTWRWMRLMVLACCNVIVLAVLPDMVKCVWGLIVCCFYLREAMRMRKLFEKVLKDNGHDGPLETNP